MSPITVLLLSMSMSVDAFAVSVGRGATLDRPRWVEAVRTGAVFGVVESMTPFLGWLAGVAANDWVADFDHWLAFLLLAAVGLHMVYGAFKPKADDDEPKSASGLVLIATAVGTSIDAMAVGLSLAFLGVGLTGILIVSAATGLATFAMSTGGLIVGRMIGDRFGKLAEVAAGVVLCGIGTAILVEHLGA